MAQQPMPAKSTLLRHPLAQLQRSMMNFPMMNLPSMWEDLEDEWNSLAWQQNISMAEDDKSIYVEASMPGLNPSEIDVTLEKGILRIRGEKKEEKEDSSKKIHCRAINSYSYRIALPQQTDEKSDPHASYKDGILKLTFAKATAAQTKKISIK
jgi:HSP20 family protein